MIVGTCKPFSRRKIPLVNADAICYCGSHEKWPNVGVQAWPEAVACKVKLDMDVRESVQFNFQNQVCKTMGNTVSI